MPKGTIMKRKTEPIQFGNHNQLRFEYERSKNDRQWYAKIVGANGENLLTSEGYKTKRACLAAIELVQAGAAEAEVREAG